MSIHVKPSDENRLHTQILINATMDQGIHLSACFEVATRVEWEDHPLKYLTAVFLGETNSVEIGDPSDYRIEIPVKVVLTESSKTSFTKTLVSEGQVKNEYFIFKYPRDSGEIQLGTNERGILTLEFQAEDKTKPRKIGS